MDTELYPKIAKNKSCSLYTNKQGDQILYKKNNQLYCRNKKKILRTKYSTKIDKFLINIDNDLSRKELTNIARIFNIKDYDSLMIMFDRLKLNPEPSLKQVKLVANILDIEIPVLHYENISEKIKNQFELKQKLILLIKKELKDSFTNSFKYILSETYNNNDDLICWIIVLLSKIILPDNYILKDDLQLSEELYNKYICLLAQEKKSVLPYFYNKDTSLHFTKLDNIRKYELIEALKHKYAKAISKCVFKNRAFSVFKNKQSKKLNPIEYAKTEILDNKVKCDGEIIQLQIPYQIDLFEYCSSQVMTDINPYLIELL
tara:strand:+ start:4908 stop:5858 length:951 start_codon:yes stop_codon:yes gene_type:complete